MGQEHQVQTVKKLSIVELIFNIRSEIQSNYQDLNSAHQMDSKTKLLRGKSLKLGIVTIEKEVSIVRILTRKTLMYFRIRL